MIKNIIRQYVRKRTTTKDKEGIMITLPDKEQVDFKEALITEILMRNGVDPNTIKTDEMLENVMAAIEKKESMEQAREQGIMGSQQADIFNTAGQKLDPNQPIIGGTQPGKAIDQDAFRRLAERNPQLIKQRIADRRVETDAEIKAKLEKGNEEGLARIRNQQKMLADAIDDASPGFANDIKVDAELVAENLAERTRMGLVYDDLPTKQRLDIYDQAYTGLSKERFKNMPKPDPEEKADGGRIGFKKGMDRRTFLKLMGGVTAAGAAAKSGILKLLGKEPTKAASKIAEVTTPNIAGKPSWFDALANRVIEEGENVTKNFATKEREVVHLKRLDDETTVYVYRDLDTGTVRVDIDDPFRNVQGDQGDALVSLEFKPGQADETTKGKPADEFTAVENDYANYMDGPDDYVTEVTDNTVTDTKDLTSDLTKVKLYAKGQKKPTIKEMMIEKNKKEMLKQAEENPSQYAADRYTGPDPEDYIEDDMASGGIAGYSGGGIVRAIIKSLAKEKGIKPSDYLKIANYKALPRNLKRIIGEEEFNRIKGQMQEGRMQMIENMRDMVRTRLDFNKRKEEFRKSMGDYGMKGMADDLIEASMGEKQMGFAVPKSATEQDFLEIEQMIKNMQTKDGRKMNASGGVASMLGE
jgi:hypothetical protein